MGSKILYSVSLRLAMPAFPFKYAKEIGSMGNAEKMVQADLKHYPILQGYLAVNLVLDSSCSSFAHTLQFY